MAKVLVSIDDDLLRTVDEQARKLGLSRSAYITRLAREAGGARRPDPAISRAIARARSEFAAAQDQSPGEDSTDFVRRMRDER